MNSTECYSIVLLALAITIGISSDSLMAQQGYSGHSGSCAGGCNHGGGGDSLELIPFGQGQSAMRQSYQPRRMPPSYGHRDAMGGGMNYSQRYQSSPPYRAAYQGSFSPPNDRGGRESYQLRREGFTYANDPAVGTLPLGHQGHGSCRGGCSRGQCGGGGYVSRAYDAGGQPTFGGQFGNEADVAPQLNMYPSRSNNSSSTYGRSRSSQSNNRQSFQMRQEHANSQTQGGIGTTSDEMYSPMGPPPSLGIPNRAGSSDCGHAGCNHDHN